MSLENITLNGKPLKQIFYKPRTQRQGARTKPGEVIYRAGQLETHVIIAGIIFPWIGKAPYVQSGMSTLGAIEYNEENDQLKCHECGGWFTNLASHISYLHHIPLDHYRLEHGLRSSAKLQSPKLREQISIRNRTNKTARFLQPAPKDGFRNPDSRKRAHETTRRRREIFIKHGFGGIPETSNLRNQCLAQISGRVKTLATKLGRTPTKAELYAIGIQTNTIKRFGLRMAQFWSSVGLAPRKLNDGWKLLGHERMSENGRKGGKARWGLSI